MVPAEEAEMEELAGMPTWNDGPEVMGEYVARADAVEAIAATVANTVLSNDAMM